MEEGKNKIWLKRKRGGKMSFSENDGIGAEFLS
jgi:hypothetical protein